MCQRRSRDAANDENLDLSTLIPKGGACPSSSVRSGAIGSETGRKATLFSTTWVKWACEIFDQEQEGQRRDKFRRVPRRLPAPNAHPQICRHCSHPRYTVRDGPCGG